MGWVVWGTINDSVHVCFNSLNVLLASSPRNRKRLVQGEASKVLGEGRQLESQVQHNNRVALFRQRLSLVLFVKYASIAGRQRSPCFKYV